MKVLKVVGIVLVTFLATLFVLPYFFKDKVKGIVESEVSSLLKAQLYLEDFSLGFYSNFPNATVSLKNFGLVGVEPFENDTLLQAQKLDAVINLASLFRDSYEISKVEVVNPTVKALVNADSLANWDIVISDSEEVEEEVEESAPIKLNLSKFTVENLNVSYQSTPDSMYAAIEGLNLNLKGDLDLDLQTLANIDNLKLLVDKIVYEDQTSSNTNSTLEQVSLDFKGKVSDGVSNLDLVLNVDSASVKMSGIPYLSKAKLAADVEMQADLDNNKFTFGDNYVKLNEIQANFAGFVQLIDSTAMDMDLTINTPSIDFKQILSLIPAIYAKNFESIKTSGNISLNAIVKGRMQGDTLPMIDAGLEVKDAMFKYPDLPSSMNGINVSAKITNPGGNVDLTEVKVPTLKFVMAGNPFSMTLGLKTPVSDPDFSVSANGVVNLGKISEVIYLEDMNLNGVLNAALKAQGKMSYVDKERYELFQIDGDLKLSDFVMNTKSLEYPVKINDANLGFTSQNVDMSANVLIGKSDLSLVGKLQNFIQYVVRGESIKGNLVVKSKLIDVNELLGTSEDVEEEETPAAASSSSVAIPDNIDFAMSVGVDELKYGAVKLSALKGNVNVKDAVAKIQSLTANTMGGVVSVVGKYDTKDSLNPNVDVNLNVNNMSISEVFTKVKTAHKLVPLFSDAEGSFSMNMDFASKMDATLSPVMNSINAIGKFKTQEIGLKNTEVFSKVADKIQLDALKNPKLKNLNISFVIKDGRLYADPFQTAISAAMLNLSGSSGLDQTLDYKANITLPKNLSSAVNLAFDVLIGGTFKQPKLSFSAASMLEEVKEKVTEKIDEAKQKAIAAAKEQKEKLIAVAKGKKDELVVIAQKSGDKLIAEAQKQSDEMQAKAANPLGKAAAKKTGDALVAKAKSNAAKLVNEAETKGNALVTEAEKQGDNLIMKAETAGPDKK